VPSRQFDAVSWEGISATRPLQPNYSRKIPVDKKAKKRIEVLRKKQEMLVKQIAGAKKQLDDPEELRKFEAELAAVLKEIGELQK